MNGKGFSAAHSTTGALQAMVGTARKVKGTDSIEPALTASDLSRIIAQTDNLPVAFLSQLTQNDTHSPSMYAQIETAGRNVFNSILATTSIIEPSFVQMWNLLDIISILSDQERCDPGLVFWLTEELLDSQTIEGCKTVFDYLESRRERLTAKHFSKKHLIILRSCNELLRRLSRAENTVFCGRVFIFLFQSFPLGDKSSVNLRGEYHTENVTTYEDVGAKLIGGQQAEDGKTDEGKIDDVKMEGVSGSDHVPTSAAETDPAAAVENNKQDEVVINNESEQVTTQETDKLLDYNTLYPIFWSLQAHFSNPTNLFDSTNLEKFKHGLEATMARFKEVQKDSDNSSAMKLLEESRRGGKRKRGEGDEYMASSFNPKYLTSRDLFELEINDLAFRRHILVQALIILDFLLSLTSEAKAKLENLNLQNKSVQYAYILSEEDAEWVTGLKSDIASYLQQGPDGKFYYRMVDTVLSRDRNWVRWKAEGCPPIELPPVSAQEWREAMDGANKLCEEKPMREVPLGGIDWSFMDRSYEEGMDMFKDRKQVEIPPPETFQPLIEEAQAELEAAVTEEEKESATEKRMTLVWQALRVSLKDRIRTFDKLDSTLQDISPIYMNHAPEAQPNGDGHLQVPGSSTPLIDSQDEEGERDRDGRSESQFADANLTA